MKNLLKLILIPLAVTPVLVSCEKEDPYAISMDVLSVGVDTIQGFEAVDLGLNVLWAKCNLGADSPEKPGYYISWGETATKTLYTEKNYAWSDGTGIFYTKYCNDPKWGDHEFTDSLVVLTPQDDPAVVNMGNGWRLPNSSDYANLRTWCTVRYCTLNGQGGFLITSIKKGYENRSIFLPMAGLMDYDEILYSDRYAFYWTNALNTSDPSTARIMQFHHEEGITDMEREKKQDRYRGLNIRPVIKRQ